MDFSSETYPGWLWGPYTLNSSNSTYESIFLSPQTVNFYLTVPDIVGVNYDLYLYKVAENNSITEVSRSAAYYQADEHISYIVTDTTAGKYMLRVGCWTNVDPLEGAWLETNFTTYDNYDFRLESYPYNNPSNVSTLSIPSSYNFEQSYLFTNLNPGYIIDVVCTSLSGFHYAYVDIEYNPLWFNYHKFPVQIQHNFGPGIGIIPCYQYPRDFQWQDGYALTYCEDVNLVQEMGCTLYEAGSSSQLYNCHAYAWTNSDQYWIDNPATIIDNLSFYSDQIVEMDDIFEDGHYANYVVFSLTENGSIKHSGKIIGQAQTFNAATIRSKLGSYGIADLMGANATNQWKTEYGEFKRYYRNVSNFNDDEVIEGAVCLDGNYPNPFKASTTIKYLLPKTDKHYEIEIYNIKDRKSVV